jgi:hypothetical protein
MAKQKLRSPASWRTPRVLFNSPLEEGTSFGAHFCPFGIPNVWPQAQKYTTPCLSNLLLSHPETFCDFIRIDKPRIDGKLYGGDGLTGFSSGDGDAIRNQLNGARAFLIGPANGN